MEKILEKKRLKVFNKVEKISYIKKYLKIRLLLYRLLGAFLKVLLKLIGPTVK